LVTAREEERRRLRRDLHDGLGPALATQTLKLEAARELLRSDPDHADALLSDLIGQSQTALADIRRLVYALRPPALDELGLVGALRAQAAPYQHAGVAVSVEAPEPLPPLPAAVEVAAYRIAQEALTNVARHARARTCVVRLRLDDALCLEVQDDGCGMQPDRRSGVGVQSMRARASELGGTWSAEALASGGTRVRARLPLGRDAPPADVEARRLP
jgi:signal transduction histidine kinase